VAMIRSVLGLGTLAWVVGCTAAPPDSAPIDSGLGPWCNGQGSFYEDFSFDADDPDSFAAAGWEMYELSTGDSYCSVLDGALIVTEPGSGNYRPCGLRRELCLDTDHLVLSYDITLESSYSTNASISLLEPSDQDGEEYRTVAAMAGKYGLWATLGSLQEGIQLELIDTQTMFEHEWSPGFDPPTWTLSFEYQDGLLTHATAGDRSLLPSGMSLPVTEPDTPLRSTHLQISQIAHQGTIIVDNIRIEAQP
jgi:hypothetical protein